MGLADIYLVQNLVNGKQYIGKAVQLSGSGKLNGTTGRWKEHVHCAKTKGQNVRQVLHKAINKYGSDKFAVSTIISVAERDASDHEIMMIELYNSMIPNGYNMTRVSNSAKLKSCTCDNV